MGADRDIFDLSGRVAIVTGGNGGIGLGIAEGLAAAGASLSIVGRDEAKTAAAAERLRGHGVEALASTADVSDETAVDKVVASTAERLGRIDILVNNAGIARRGLPAGLHDRGLGRCRGHQPQGHVLVFQGRPPAHGEGRRREGHQHRLDGLDIRARLGARVRRQQGGRGAARQEHGRRLGEGQHPGQRGPARMDRDRPSRRRFRISPPSATR